MKITLAINGFGRIGRLVFRSLLEKDFLGYDINFIVNDLVSTYDLAYLLQFDSVHGRLPIKVDVSDNIIWADYNGKKIKIEVLSKKVLPNQLPWQEKKVDVVIESTGLFKKKELAEGHLKAGAKKVIISAPSDSDVKTILMGVNESDYAGEDIVSNASCTTNALAPLIHVLLKEGIGLKEGLLTTVHAYTSSQNLVDGPSSSLRKGRAAAFNIVPTTTGATKAICRVFPQLDGKITGMALRVPVIDVSCIDFTFKPERSTSIEQINELMRTASKTYMKGILTFTDHEIVSSDCIGDAHSSIYDSKASLQLNSEFFKLIAWYDNEWAYSNRIVDLLNLVLQKSF
jgi:glyceraldehyde 3-phosphate dehydrogenase